MSVDLHNAAVNVVKAYLDVMGGKEGSVEAAQEVNQSFVFQCAENGIEPDEPMVIHLGSMWLLRLNLCDAKTSVTVTPLRNIGSIGDC